ncbi:DNA helicase, partial [Streptococcus danieliae]|nr:DNA helicase [Streptococcus danieliae]
MARTAARARSAIDAIQPILSRSGREAPLVDQPMDEVRQRLCALASDDLTAQKLPEVNRLRTELEELGLGDFVADIAARDVPEERIDDELTYCWWSSVLARTMRDDPAMGGLDARALTRLAAALRELDAAQSQSLPGPVAQA